MSRVLNILPVVVCFVLAAGTVRAQQPIVPPGAIDQALTQQSSDVAAKREAIRSALQQPDVRRVAERMGLDIARAEGATGTLAGAELDRMAVQAQLVNEAIAGGQTVRLNLLWIIIGLLILIIIILVA